MPGDRRVGRPPGQRGDDTRALVLETALRLFGEAGYGGVSMDRLAEECGLTVRAVYHYFPSKRDLFDAVGDLALARFGDEVAVRVFGHDALADRLRGYLDVLRHLHQHDPDVLPFIGMSMVDAITDDIAAVRNPDVAPPAEGPGAAVRTFIGVLVDDAVRRGEVRPGLDRDGAVNLLVMIGRGAALAALSEPADFPATLDALQLLVEGRLFAESLWDGTAEK